MLTGLIAALFVSIFPSAALKKSNLENSGIRNNDGDPLAALRRGGDLSPGLFPEMPTIHPGGGLVVGAGEKALAGWCMEGPRKLPPSWQGPRAPRLARLCALR